MTVVPHNPAVLAECRPDVDPGRATYTRAFRSDDRRVVNVVSKKRHVKRKRHHFASLRFLPGRGLSRAAVPFALASC